MKEMIKSSKVLPMIQIDTPLSREEGAPMCPFIKVRLRIITGQLQAKDVTDEL